MNVIKANLSWVILISLALIWGSSYILMKKAMYLPSGEQLLLPPQVAAIRMSLAGLFILPFAFVYKVKLLPKNWYLFLLSGLLGNFIPAFLFTAAQTELSSSFTAMLNSIVPFFSFVIGLLFFKMPFNKFHLIGLLIGFFGALGLIYSQFGGVGQIHVFSTLLVVFATLCYASNLNIIKVTLAKEKAVEISILSLLYVMPIALFYLFGRTDFAERITTSGGQVGLIYASLLALFSTTLALLMFTYLIKISTAVFASSVTYIIPIFAIMWGVLDGETLAISSIGFMLVIMSGIYLLRK